MQEYKQPRSLPELLRQLDAQNITDHRRYKAVQRFLDSKARERGVPLSGTFELTPLCNLDCKMCYVHLNKEQMKGAQLLTTDQWKDIMQQAIDAGMMYATLTGGECLTYPGFKELYLFLRSKGIETAILSNGLLMDAEMVDFLKANPPALIQVTLYGASEEGYERVTGRRVFARVMENIKRIRDAEIPITIAVTPNAYMTDGEEIIRLLHGEGLGYNINPGIIQPREETGRMTADAEIELYVSLLKLQRELNGREIEPECEPESLPDIGGKQSESPKGVRCGAGRSSFSIDWRGGMKPCHTFPCGPLSVLETGFFEAWKRTNELANNYSRPAECEGCAYKGSCKHCVAEHASGAEAGHASPAICAWTQRMVAEGLLKLASPDQ